MCDLFGGGALVCALVVYKLYMVRNVECDFNTHNTTLYIYNYEIWVYLLYIYIYLWWVLIFLNIFKLYIIVLSGLFKIHMQCRSMLK